MAAASYFAATNYGNAPKVYPGVSGIDARSLPLGLASAFLLGMVGVGVFGNLTARDVRLYGAFRPGLVRANTLLSAFQVIVGPSPRLAPFDNILTQPDQSHPVPPYGNGFQIT